MAIGRVLVCCLLVISHSNRGRSSVQETQIIDLTRSGIRCGMSSSYYYSNGIASDCHAAINGNTSAFMFIGEEQQNCIHTAVQSDQLPLWWVDMGRAYTVDFIRIYARADVTHRVKHMTIAIDQHVIYDTGVISTLTPKGDGLYFDIIGGAGLPYTGRNLTITRNDTDVAETERMLNFCEIQVFECKDGYFGVNCSSSCPTCAAPNICNKINGQCECPAGYYANGGTCETCGHCGRQVRCNNQNGSCVFCERGWSLPLCNACSPGYHGLACTSCGEGCQSGVCQQDGTCSCTPGWTTQYCNAPCQHGYYGQDCKLQCSAGCNENRKCDNVDGTCVCQREWRGDNCTECSDGYFGQACSYVCGHCKDGAICDKRNGHCAACDGSYEMPFCQDECSDGHYGSGCASLCGHCEGRAPCHKMTGQCLACDGPYRMPLCTQKITCDKGSWGDNCSRTCGNCEGDGSCDVLTGVCNSGACLAGWSGADCLQKPDTSENSLRLVGPIVGALLGAGVLVAFSVITAAFVRRTRRTRAKSRRDAPSDSKKVKPRKPDLKETSLSEVNAEHAAEETTSRGAVVPENDYDVLENYVNTGKDARAYAQLQTGTPHTQGRENQYEQVGAQYHNTGDAKQYEALSSPCKKKPEASKRRQNKKGETSDSAAEHPYANTRFIRPK